MRRGLLIHLLLKEKKMLERKAKLFLVMIVSTIVLTSCSKTPTVKDETVNLTAASDINTRLGMSYLEQGDVRRAKQRFLKALQEAPDNPASWYSMGYFFEVTGNNAEAEKYFKHAISLAPANGNAKNNYGTFLCHTGRYREGIQQFFAAVNSPNYLDMIGAYENIGICAMKIPDYKLAEEYLNKALAQDPNRAESLGALALLNYDTKNYKTSREYFDRYKAQSTAISPDMRKLGTDLKKMS